VQWFAGSDRLTLDHVDIVGAAAAPLSVVAPNCRLESVTVDAGPGHESYIGGERTVVDFLHHPDRRVYFLDGEDMAVIGGWVHYANYGGDPQPDGTPPGPSSGVSVGVRGVNDPTGKPYTLGPGASWQVL
jgi:hypothetical protein